VAVVDIWKVVVLMRSEFLVSDRQKALIGGKYAISQTERDLWNYKVGRAVAAAFKTVRTRLKASVTQSGGNYENLWNQQWWKEAVDAEVRPVLKQMYEKTAKDAALALGLAWLVTSGEVNRVANERLATRMTVVYGIGDTIDGRVAVASSEATGETPGWLMDRLGLFDPAGSGPLSDGVVDVVSRTETNNGQNTAAAVAFFLLLLLLTKGSTVGTGDGLGDGGGDGTGDGVDMAGLVATKRWVCQFINSRDTHIQAHNQEVAIYEFFTIGGFPAEYPGDMSLPPEETVNCRCELEYDVLYVGTGIDNSQDVQDGQIADGEGL